jgi:UDP-2,3-diacylglucosamine hydrolase
MRLYIVSDLHIYSAEDPVYRSLLSLIRDEIKSGDVLVLAGDIFDLFVGNKKIFREKYQLFLKSLEQATHAGAQIHYIEGNHDFQLRQVFQGIQGLRVEDSEVTLELSGKKFSISHGDLAHSHDYPYLLLRKVLRSLLFKWILKLIPGSWIHAVGQFLSKKSRDSQPVLFAHLPVERQEELRKIYRNTAAQKIVEGFDFVVMGHCHDLDEKLFQVAGRIGQYINVGYPRVHGSLLVWDSQADGGESKIFRVKLPNSVI